MALDWFEAYAEARERDGSHSTAIARVAGTFGLDVRDLEKVAEAQHWELRFREWCFARSAEAVERSRLTSPYRHIQLARQLQERGREALERLDVRTLEEARRLIHTGIEIERLVIGESTQRVEIREEDLRERLRWLFQMCRAARPELFSS